MCLRVQNPPFLPKKPVIPVLWDDVPGHIDLLSQAEYLFLQGGSLSDLHSVLDMLGHPQLQSQQIYLNLDLLSGLSVDVAALQYIAAIPRITGIITTRHNLTQAAHKLGLRTIVRIFLQDSRALDRGLHIAQTAKPDALELLPGVAAAHIATDFANLSIPILAGGLIRSPQSVRDIISAGIQSVSTSNPDLWVINSV
ncbi:glycerol-3-phosphate responsive antiterminator [Poriferisphaera sp. WC338]|uniref:glycerol-3-phosphate responsive antiterminator n=1 Tax=Poriferisphaera sp. WC338 TaxID=3425129 RepID=UPI003D8127D5